VLLTMNVVQKFERVWMDIFYGIDISTIEVTRVLESRPWPVADRPDLWRGQSGPLARTVRSLDPDRAMHFFSL
jgi:hypothetical protein